jgi:hypothetical protein
MALFSPSESPAVVVKEIDLTGGVPNVQSTTGAIVGNYRWGPADKRMLIANETELVDTFAAPDSNNTVDFHSASYFLRYSSNMQVVRSITSTAKNAFSSDSANTAQTLKNEDVFATQESFLISQQNTFLGRYPGDLANGLTIERCVAGDSAAFNNWTYANEFDAKPESSTFISNKNGQNDEVHIVVVDGQGKFTGTKGAVLERYPFLSVAKDAKNTTGSSIFVRDVINETSDFVYMAAFDSDVSLAQFSGSTAVGRAGSLSSDSGDDYNIDAATYDSAGSPGKYVRAFTLASGVASGVLGTSEYATGYDLFEDKDQIEIDFLISPSMATRTDHDAVVSDLIGTAAARKDCVTVFSPARDDVVNLTNSSTITSNITATGDAITPYSSYAFMDGNFLKVYDKFNDQFIFIPAASSTAGIMAATDLNRAAWFSPAGSRRGQYLGITSLAWTPTKGQRDSLYKKSINPIANIPGSGVILFGDKTGLRRSSAFDRINVRRLFLILERAISRAAEQVLFEFNDEFTRAEFVNIIEPVLREVKGRRGITDFRVVADATNNTATVIDRNEFKADIFIKPARSINYVTLNFVAVRTGVDFEEVVGTV